MIEMLATALVPIFFGLLLGYVAGIRGWVDNGNVRTLVSLVMNYALPCALFLAISQSPDGLLETQGRLILLLAVVYLILYWASYWFGRTVLQASPSDGAVLALTLGFPNVTAVGIPLLDAVYGKQTAATVAMGIAAGAMTISPITLAILEKSTMAGHALPPGSIARSAILRAIRRPVVWAPAVGLLVAMCHLSIPIWFARSLSVMGAATAGAALFLTGLVVSAQRIAFGWPIILAIVAKNLIQPALCLGFALIVALPLEQTRSAVLISAIPCGFFGIIFGKGLNSTPQVASSALVLSYVAGVFTLAAWLLLLGHLR